MYYEFVRVKTTYTNTHISIVQSSIYLIEQISLRLKFVKLLFFSYDNSPVFLIANYVINSNFFLFLFLTTFFFVFSRAREAHSFEKGRRKVSEGGASRPAVQH